MDKLSFLKKLRTVMIVTLLLFQSSISTFAQYNPHKLSHHIVESFGSIELLGMVVPLKQVEKKWNYRVDGIYYLVDQFNDSTRKILPNEYGYLRWKYLKQKLDISPQCLPLHTVDQHSQFAGRGEGNTFEEKQQSLVEQISALIQQSTSQVHIAEKRVLIDKSQDQNEIQVTFYINWDTLPDTENLSRSKYTLFLVADEIYLKEYY